MSRFQPIQTLFFAILFSGNMLFAQAELEPLSTPNASVLTVEKWKQVDASVKRGLEWLATQQKADGSFKSVTTGQPGVTSFCLMAFLAQGESPANGKYQKQLSKAIEFIVAQQTPNGLIASSAPGAIPIPRVVADHDTIGGPAVYSHAISGLALSEAYGQCSPDQAKRLAPVIEKAIAATLEMQRWGPKQRHNVGGWRYLDLPHPGDDSDLSITGWQLMFLRSAKNAGFDVPQESIDSAVRFVEKCFLTDKKRQVHVYVIGKPQGCTRAMAGAGVLALAHAGKHDSEEARASGEWILKHDFKKYNNDEAVYGCIWLEDRYHYGSFLCSQAMFQLGGKYWKQFFPILVDTLLDHQRKTGAWAPEKRDAIYGSCYTTSLCILSLSVPNQMLPVFQR